MRVLKQQPPLKLLYSPSSPFVSKVRLAAHMANLELELVAVNSGAGDPVLDAANPLKKIPTLIDPDGRAIYDSRVIMRYIDNMSSYPIIPTDKTKRTDAAICEALADGVSDSAVACIYEQRMRPLEKVHQGWIDRQWGKVESGLDALNANPPSFDIPIHIGHLATAAMLGYLDLRFAGKWQNGRDDLVACQNEFANRVPEYENLKATG